jgi:hypothetical protein
MAMDADSRPTMVQRKPGGAAAAGPAALDPAVISG